MKKVLPFFILIILAVGALLLLAGKKSSKTGTVTPTPEPAKSTTLETELKDRPYVTLTPRTDGKELVLAISRIKDTNTIEYELVYLSNGLSRGVIGSINIDSETEITRNLLLGSCSKDVCRYDENVSEGSLTLRFRSPAGVRKFSADFHLQTGNETLTALDKTFQLEGKLSSANYYVTMSTIGLPAATDKNVIGGPYGVFSSTGISVKNLLVSITLAEENSAGKIFSWDKSGWVQEDKGFQASGATVSAQISKLTTYIVASD